MKPTLGFDEALVWFFVGRFAIRARLLDSRRLGDHRDGSRRVRSDDRSGSLRFTIDPNVGHPNLASHHVSACVDEKSRLTRNCLFRNRVSDGIDPMAIRLRPASPE